MGKGTRCLFNASLLIGVEHPLNFIRIIGFRKRKGKQQPCFPRLQVVAGDETEKTKGKIRESKRKKNRFTRLKMRLNEIRDR